MIPSNHELVKQILHEFHTSLIGGQFKGPQLLLNEIIHTSSRGRIRRRIVEIQNRGEDFSGARSNETRGRDNETREPIRARRLRRRSGSVVGGVAPRGGAPARSDDFAAGSRSGNGSHRSTWKVLLFR